MDLARAPRRRPLTARKKGSGYENGTYHVYHVALPRPVTPSLLTAPVNLVPRAFVKALGTRLSPGVIRAADSRLSQLLPVRSAENCT